MLETSDVVLLHNSLTRLPFAVAPVVPRLVADLVADAG